MPVNDIEEALKTTFLDHRLTRGERKGLKRIIDDIGGDERDLALARNFAFQLARDQIGGPDAAAAITWLEDVMKVLAPMDSSPGQAQTSEAYFSPSDPCVNKIVRLFEDSRDHVDICVFTITDDRISRAIEKAHRRNVRIRVLSDNDKSEDLGSDIDSLRRQGVAVKVDQSEYHMHHKFALFDNQRLLTGSYNWTRSAAESNEENFIVTGDSELIQSFRRAFDRMWAQF